jgi:hypothetical protein
MAEDDGLSTAPIVVIDFRAVRGLERRHCAISFVSRCIKCSVVLADSPTEKFQHGRSAMLSSICQMSALQMLRIVISLYPRLARPVAILPLAECSEPDVFGMRARLIRVTRRIIPVKCRMRSLVEACARFAGWDPESAPKSAAKGTLRLVTDLSRDFGHGDGCKRQFALGQFQPQLGQEFERRSVCDLLKHSH